MSASSNCRPGSEAGVEASLHNGQLAVRVLRGDCTQPLTLTPS